MYGLILKDLLGLKKYCRTAVLIILFYFVLSFMFDFSSFLAAMTIMMLTMMSITSFSYDEFARWDNYVLTLPISRKAIVVSKYILALILIIIGIVLSTILSLLTVLAGQEMVLGELFATIGAISMVAMIIVSIMFPLLYRFGVEKSRLMLLGVVAVPTIIVIVLQKLGVTFSDEQFILLFKSAPLFVLICFVLSIVISCKIYQKKELK